MRQGQVLSISLLLVSLLVLSSCDWFKIHPPPPEPAHAASFDPKAIAIDPATGAEIVPDQVIVRFKEGINKKTIEATIAGFNCKIVGKIPQLNIYQLKVPSGVAPADLVAQLEDRPHVQWAELNYIIYSDTLSVNTPAHPDDDYFHEQWALHNTGQTGGIEDADIDALEAWAIEKGHPKVTIAIIDSGVDYEHKDLKDNYRSDGYDFADNDPDPRDERGHGTAVAGVAVASMDGQGVVGVAPGASFVPIRVLDEKGALFGLAVAILYAVEQVKAKIVNISLRGSGGLWERFKVIEAVIAVAVANDVFIVTSAGNSDSSGGKYLAVLPGVMAVAATDHNDKRSVWKPQLPPGSQDRASNYGDWIDVSAPGGSSEAWIWTTWPNHNYQKSGGTSLAAAFVSGVAALIWSLDYRDGDFDLSAKDVMAIIKDTADPIDDLNPGFEGKLGAGRVNAYKALLEAARRLGLNLPPIVTITSPPDGSSFSVGQSIHFDGSGSYDPDGKIVSYKWDFGDGAIEEFGTGGETVDHAYTEAGTYTVTLTVEDNAGATGTDSVTITVTTTGPAPGCTVTLSPGDSIQKAIDEASPSAVICLTPGSWEENITIEKSLALRGAGADQTTIKSQEKGQPVIRIERDAEIGVRIEGITVTGARLLWAWEEEAAIAVRGHAHLILTASTVRANERHGIVIMDSARATISGSTIEGNGECGIVIMDSARATITDNTIQDNGWGIISYSYLSEPVKGSGNRMRGNCADLGGNLSARLRDPLVSEMGKTQLHFPGPYPTLQETIDALAPGGTITVAAGSHQGCLTIWKPLTLKGQGPDEVVIEGAVSLINEAQGVRIDGVTITESPVHASLVPYDFRRLLFLGGRSRATISGSTIKGNEAFGIVIAHLAQATIANSTIKGNGLTGIWIEGLARASIANSTIEGNGLIIEGNGSDGIHIEGLAQASITNSTITIRGYGYYSIWIGDSARATISSSTVEGSGWEGIKIGDSAQAAISSSTVVGDWLDGIWIGNSAQATISRSTVRENRDGIAIMDSARATLEENRITSNATYGVALGERPCFDTDWVFQGYVAGHSNEIPGPGEPEGNGWGAVCPDRLKFLMTKEGGKYP